MIELAGNICIKQGNILDYSWREAIASLLPVCERVYVADGGSTDGTLEDLLGWATNDPRIVVLNYPWPEPRGSITFWTDWINWCRERIKEPFHFELDSDECVHENSYQFIHDFKQRTNPEDNISLWMSRLNFWRDAQHLIPHGVCCGHKVCRIAPTRFWLPSDGPDDRGQAVIAIAQDSPIELGHYGFLRKREAFFAKAKALQSYFFDSYDPRLAAVEERQIVLDAENKSGNWMAEIAGVDWINRLVPFTKSHPKVIHQWLRDRGYSPT